MSIIETHAPGSFCWVELGTTDAKAAKAFYGAVFGWEPDDMPMGSGQFYTMLKLNGKHAGAMYELDQSMRAMGIPSHWMLYVAVKSADDAAAKAKSLGAKAVKDPFDVFDAGRMAVLQDPTGATFSVWQANKNTGIQVENEVNALCWSELWTTDKLKALEFYTGLFGWTTRLSTDAPEDYIEIANQGHAMGGILQIKKEWGNIPPTWLPYFMVTNCDATVAKINQLGGANRMPSTDIPNVGRFALVSDPQGAVFEIVQLAQKAA